MRLGDKQDVGHYIGSQQVQKIYYNSVEIYSLIPNNLNNLELNDLSGYILQEDGSLIKLDV
jgi:hypothetical protein